MFASMRRCSTLALFVGIEVLLCDVVVRSCVPFSLCYFPGGIWFIYIYNWEEQAPQGLVLSIVERRWRRGNASSSIVSRTGPHAGHFIFRDWCSAFGSAA